MTSELKITVIPYFIYPLRKGTTANFNDVRLLLEAFGFIEKRSKGSHHTFEDARGQVFTLPKKGGKKVRRVYIKRIVELLNLQRWQDESSDQSTDDN